MITKELQDLAWRCLPRETRKEARQAFALPTNNDYEQGYDNALVSLFGTHNLTSDTEGEEMLTVSRKRVQKAYEECDRYFCFEDMLADLFGSKCLPDEEQPKQRDCDNPLADKEGCKWLNNGKCAFDSACYFEPLNPQESKPKSVSEISEEISDRVAKAIKVEFDKIKPKPTEPKFKRGDMVIYKPTGKKKVVFGRDKYGRYRVALPNMQSPMYVNESELEPYTEPTETCTDDCPSPCPSQDFDNIIKDGFRDHNRLHIATHIAAAIVSRGKGYDAQEIAITALEIADELIKQSEL